MSGTNPGARPDDWHGDVDDGKRKAFAELDKTIPLYTAADLKAARLETVERCMGAVNGEFLDDPQDCEGDEAYNVAIVHAKKAIEKLKEEIEND